VEKEKRKPCYLNFTHKEGKERKKNAYATISGETKATHHFRKKKMGSRHPFIFIFGCPLP